MRRLTHASTVLLSILIALPAGLSAAPVPQNDAGSGGDAPDVPSAGAPIASGVVYDAQLTDGDHHDWFAFSAPAGAEVQVRVLGGYGCFEIADASGDAVAHDCAIGPYVEAPLLIAAVPTSGTWYFHYENVPLDAYRFSIGIDEPAAAPLAGPAPPRIDVPGSEQNDAGSGGDAPDGLADDLRVGPGVVYEGYLDGLDDDSDWYAFDAAAGDTIHVRERALGVNCYYLHGPDGNQIDFACSDVATDLVFQRSLTVAASVSGTYYLNVRYFDPHTYYFSIGINEPAPPLGGPGALPATEQDDAGSGGDAPDHRSDDLRILSGVAYEGYLDGLDDDSDWYAFDAAAGDTIHVRERALGVNCYYLHGPDGGQLDFACSDVATDIVFQRSLTATASVSGTYYLNVRYFDPHTYYFSIGINEPAPPVGGLAGSPALDQNDAGSGGDAPNEPSGKIPIASGVIYDGYIDGVWDSNDWYALDLAAGDAVEIVVRAAGVNCYYLHGPEGQEIDFSCSDVAFDTLGDRRISALVVSTGTHYLRVAYFDPHSYRFGVGINEPAPPVTTPLPGDALSARTAWPAPSADVWLRAARTGEIVELAVAERALRVVVHENDLLITPFAKLPREADDVTLLAGSANGMPVRLTILGDAVTGHIFPTKGRAITLSTLTDGRNIAYEEMFHADHVGLAFDDESEEPAGGGFGGCLQPVPTRLANPLGLALGWPQRTFDVAFAVDDDFVARHGASWAARALGYANALDGFYESQIGLRVRVADIHAHAAGDIEGSSTSSLLAAMSAHYGRDHAGMERESGHLFTGKPLTGVVGQASCIGGAGEASLAYTVSRATNPAPSGFLGLQWFPDVDLKIAAHELGHILSAHHHYSNCGAERLLMYDPIHTLDACTLMINDIGLASMQLSSVNKLTTRGWSEHADL